MRRAMRRAAAAASARLSHFMHKRANRKQSAFDTVGTYFVFMGDPFKNLEKRGNVQCEKGD
jgi:hypothetical protein